MLSHGVRVPLSLLLVRKGRQVFKLTHHHHHYWPRPTPLTPCLLQSCHHDPFSSGHIGDFGSRSRLSFSTSAERTSKDTTAKTIIGLKSKAEVEDFLGHLSSEQKTLLFNSLNLDILRRKYQSELGNLGDNEVHPYLSKLGRPTTHPAGEEDPTGTLSHISPTWLIQRSRMSTYLLSVFINDVILI